MRAQTFIDALAFAAPEIEALYLPSWDCQPYDRVSPNAAVSAERMTVLARLARTRGAVERPRVLVGSVNALTQRVPPLNYVASAAFSAAPGNSVRMDDLALWLETNGYARASTVRDVGDYAMRGGILDLYPPGAPAPIRLDFFGDTLESIRTFDPETQRSVGQLRSLDLVPMSEARLTTETIRRFRQAYAAEFGAPTPDDELYAAVSEGRRPIGLEHWLPLLYERLDTLFDYVGDAPFVLDARAEEAAGQRLAQIADSYRQARAAYAPGPGEGRLQAAAARRLYLSEDEWKERLAAAPARAAHALRGERRRSRRRRLRRPGRAQFRARAAGRERQRVRRRGRAHQGSAQTRPERDRRRLERRLARAAEPRARRARAEIARARLLLASGEDGARRARCRSR